MKCPKCGQEIANDSAYCEFCGETIKENSSNNQLRVNIRWVLLPAMILTTIALWTHYESGNERPSIINSAFITFLPSALILILSIWFFIRKKITWLFFFIIGVLFLSNGAMLYEIGTSRDIRQYYNDIRWMDNNGHHCVQVSCKAYPDSRNFILEYQLEMAKNNISTCVEYLVSSLREHKMTKIQKGEMSSNFIHERSHNYGETCLLVAVILTLLYLICAMIAREKNWKY